MVNGHSQAPTSTSMDTSNPLAQPKCPLIVPGSSETDNAHPLGLSASDQNQNDSSSVIRLSTHLEHRIDASGMSYPPSAQRAGDGEESEPMLRPNDRSRSPRPSEDWTPLPARMLVVCPLILGNLCLICALVVLWHLSQSRHGLFATNLRKSEVLALWHFSPTVIVTIDSLVFGAVGAASLRCQPYLHLLRKDGANAEDSLTLDYNGPSFVVPFKAICRRHWVAFMFSLVMLSVFCFPGQLFCH